VLSQHGWFALCAVRPAPTHHVGQGEEGKDEQLELVEEETLEVAHALDHTGDNVLGVGSAGLGIGVDAVGTVDFAEHLDGQRGRGLSVELCDLVEDVDGFLLLALGE
jgi:hypothetical protein